MVKRKTKEILPLIERNTLSVDKSPAEHLMERRMCACGLAPAIAYGAQVCE